MTGRQPPTPCPVCNHTLNAWTPTDVDSKGPSPNDVSVCAYCHVLLVYADDLTLRLPDEEELQEICEQLGWKIA